MEESFDNATPRFTSTSKKNHEKYRRTLNLNQQSQQSNSSDDSFGVLSIKTSDLDLIPERFSSLDIQNIHDEAHKTLERSARLPSRFLRKQDVSSTYNNTLESTISESDLFRSKSSHGHTSSTPRESISLAESMAKLSRDLMSDKTMTLEKFQEEFEKTMNGKLSLISTSYVSNSSKFVPGEDMEEKLKKDEEVWSHKYDIPKSIKDLTLDNFDKNSQLSISSYFRKGSDDLTKLLGKSPKKQQKPQPLIDSMNFSNFSKDSTEIDIDNSSMSVSAIAKMLSETHNTPNKVMDVLMNNPKKKSTASSVGKENQEVTRDKSSPISRSSSSLSQLPNGKLPLETTKTQLIWGCVKIGKSALQEFRIRNTSDYRLKISCSLSNPAFKIKEGTELETAIKMILHPQESKTITINFMPTKNEAAIDELKFISLEMHHHQSKPQKVKLYGYGGFANVTIADTFKDLSGRLLLSLGTVGETPEVQQEFLLKNLGTLPAFAICNFITKSHFNNSQFIINPRALILAPNEEQKITITYIPSKYDLKSFSTSQMSVIDLGVINLITGPEVIRYRLRNISEGKNPEGFEDIFQILPGEKIPNDLRLLKENWSSAMKELQGNLCRREITIILEQDLNATCVNQLDDDTIFFQTFAEDQTQIMNGTLLNANTSCSVEPSSIILNNWKLQDFIFINNSSMDSVKFKCDADRKGLIIEPKSGTIAEGKHAMVSVKVASNNCHKSFQIMVNVNDDIFYVDVKIINVKN